jgi:hypothetical protein
MQSGITWPEGKSFAFTIFDDTDSATVDNVRGVYDLLGDLDFRTTKSCWVLRGDAAKGKHAGQTCEDPQYAAWLRELQTRGFEIAWHGATWHGTPREGTLAAMEKFADLFGHYPATAANHSGVDEGMYWADARFSGIHVPIYNILTRCRNRGKYRGHLEHDDYFWGDICRERIRYYRNFVFQGVNTLKACPFMPYHDPSRPYVNHWFASSDGNRLDRFNQCLSEENQDRLEMQGGACIMYTHFANGFSDGGKVDRRFSELMARLSKKNGWYVPVVMLLDRLLEIRGRHDITASERRRLERKWLFEKLFVGTT